MHKPLPDRNIRVSNKRKAEKPVVRAIFVSPSHGVKPKPKVKPLSVAERRRVEINEKRAIGGIALPLMSPEHASGSIHNRESKNARAAVVKPADACNTILSVEQKIKEQTEARHNEYSKRLKTLEELAKPQIKKRKARVAKLEWEKMKNANNSISRR